MGLMPSVTAGHGFSLRLAGSSLLFAASAVLLTSCADYPDAGNVAAEAGSTLEVPQGWRNGGTGDVVVSDSQTGTLSSGDEVPLLPLNAENLTAWWTQFDDPVLDELIDIALRDSPSIRTALSKVEESRARRGVAFGSLLPSLSGKLTARDTETRNHKTHTNSSNQTYTAGLDMSWEIDLFGKLRLTYDASTSDWEQSQENFYAAQVSLAAEVAEAYVELRAAQSQLDVVLRNIAARAQTTELTLWRAQAGDVSEMEAQQALSTLEQARAAVPSAELTAAQTRNRLALLCGLTPGSLDAVLTETRPVPAVHADLALGIPAETLRQRPDVRAAEKALLATMQRLGASERERLPSLSLSGSIGVEALKSGNLFSPDATAASILGSLVAPLFQGGKITQGIALSKAQSEQALISYELTVLTALSEVENSLIGVRQYLDRLHIVRRAAGSAQIAATLAAQRYEAGQTDLLTVLEAQRTQLSLEEQVVSTTASLTSAHIQLYKALGGGWSVQHTPAADGVIEIAAAPSSASSSSASGAPAASALSGADPAAAGSQPASSAAAATSTAAF